MKKQDDSRSGWHIITLHNDFFDATRYEVRYLEWVSGYYPPPKPLGPFDDYDTALTAYHEKVGWKHIKEEVRTALHRQTLKDLAIGMKEKRRQLASQPSEATDPD